MEFIGYLSDVDGLLSYAKRTERLGTCLGDVCEVGCCSKTPRWITYRGGLLKASLERLTLYDLASERSGRRVSQQKITGPRTGKCNNIEVRKG